MYTNPTSKSLHLKLDSAWKVVPPGASIDGLSDEMAARNSLVKAVQTTPTVQAAPSPVQNRRPAAKRPRRGQ